MATEIAARPATRHEALPRPGTAYTMRGPNTGLPADLRNLYHYPVEAVCSCGEMIRCEYMLPLGPGADWKHLGRRPGEDPS